MYGREQDPRALRETAGAVLAGPLPQIPSSDKSPEVQREFKILEEQVNALHQAIDQLTGRLSAVIQAPVNSKIPPPTAPRATTILGKALCDLSDGVRSARARIQELYENIQL